MPFSFGHNISLQSQNYVIKESKDTVLRVGNKKLGENLSNRNGNISFIYKALYIFRKYLKILS